MWLDLFIFMVAFGGGFVTARVLDGIQRHRELLAKEAAACAAAVKRASKPRKKKEPSEAAVVEANKIESLYGRANGESPWQS